MPMHSAMTPSYWRHDSREGTPWGSGHGQFDLRGIQGYLMSVKVCCHRCPSAVTSHGLSLASGYRPRHAAATIDTATEGLQGCPPKPPFRDVPRRRPGGTVWHCVSMQPCVFVLARRPWPAHPPKAAHPAVWRGHRIHARYPDGRDMPAGRPQRGEVSRVPMVASRRRRVCGCGRMDGP